MTSSNGNSFRLTGHLCEEFPAQRPVTRGFDVFFDLRPDKRLSKQSWGWWFETPSHSLWRHCNASVLSHWHCMWQAYDWPIPVHYIDVIMGAIASQITSLTIVYSTVNLGEDQRKHQSSASLAFVQGIHRDRWIPRTNGQWRGKCFHLMTPSWNVPLCMVMGL